jgi:hypothetical protein
MKLVISVDVEEEGLFSGHYARTPPGVTNVEHLRRLEFIPREFGFPLTLLVTYQVARDPAARQVLEHWRNHLGAEIGAHLHHWNTPPFLDPPQPEPVNSEALPSLLLREKFATLVGSLRTHLGVSPISFRMGRFDLGSHAAARLPEFGLRVDSSVVPLRQVSGGPEHFLAPADPYALFPAGPQGPSIIEAPLTQVPFLAGAPGTVARIAAALPRGMGVRLLSGFRYWGVVGIQPAWFPLAAMRRTVRLHRRRGGQVLTMFLHSSELQPGATPQFPTETAVIHLVSKLRAFLSWLAQTFPVQGCTLAQLFP